MRSNILESEGSLGKRRDQVPILRRLSTCHNSYRFKITTATAAMKTMRTKKPTVNPTIKPVFDDGLAEKPREKWKLVQVSKMNCVLSHKELKKRGPCNARTGKAK